MPKYHNFKVLPPSGSTTTYYYFSKCGNDSNIGTDPNLPFKTLGFGSGAINVVGAGHYTGTGALSSSLSTPQIIADGRVIIEGASWNNMTPHRIVGVTFKDITTIATREGYWNYGGVSHSNKFINCGIVCIVFGPGVTGERNIFINCNLINEHKITISKSIIRSMTGTCSATITNCDVDANSVIHFTENVPLDNYFQYNNYRGIFRITLNSVVRDYAIQDQRVGTPQDNGYAAGVKWMNSTNLIADGYTHSAASVDWAVSTCIARDPMFSDAAGEDFTLQANSPNIRRASDGTNLGGQEVSISIVNSDNGNLAGTRVIPTSQIDTTIANAYKLKAGFDEGYVDYVFKNNGSTMKNLDLKDVFTFNSDIDGGQVGNKDVPDAEPVTNQYPFLVLTTANSAATNQLVVSTGKIAVGKHVRVDGECRLVTVVTPSGANDILTLSSALRNTKVTGTEVTYGTEGQLASINPNRLTVFMRTKTTIATPAYPFIDSEWDNGLDAAYGKAGYLFNQEINTKPILMIDGNNVYGGGDSDAPVGLAPQEMAPQWVHVRVYKRNNYRSKGLPA